MKAILYFCLVWLALLVIFNIAFYLWVYITRRDFGCILDAWANRHKGYRVGLSYHQALLLRVIGLTERGLGYFGLLVVVPLKVLLLIIKG